MFIVLESWIMPLFDVVCRDCGARAELLLRSGAAPACPTCHSLAVEKQLGRIAPLAGGQSDPPMMGCGKPSCCQLQGGCAN